MTQTILQAGEQQIPVCKVCGDRKSLQHRDGVRRERIIFQAGIFALHGRGTERMRVWPYRAAIISLPYFQPTMQYRLRSLRRQARQRGNQIGKALALNHDVITQQFAGRIAPAFDDRLDYRIMLGKRCANTAAHA